MALSSREEVDSVSGLEGPPQLRQLGQSPEQAGALVGGSVPRPLRLLSAAAHSP